MKKLILILLILTACNDSGNNVQSYTLLWEFDPTAEYNYIDNNSVYTGLFEEREANIKTTDGFEYSGLTYYLNGFYVVDLPEFFIFANSENMAVRVPKSPENGATYYNNTYNKNTNTSGEEAWLTTWNSPVGVLDIEITRESIIFSSDNIYFGVVNE